MKLKRDVRRGGARGPAAPFHPLATLILAAALLGLCTAAFADVTVFSDGFDASFAGWTQTSHPDWYTGTPKNGTHSIQLKASEAIERVVSTAGYTGITVSFSLAANSLDNSNEIVRASWYNGTSWTTLKEIRGGGAENDGVLRSYSYLLPASANDNSSLRLRFEIISSNHGNDYGYVDDVLVTGQAIQRTLTLAGTGSGSVRVNGVLQSLPWSGQFAHGSQVTLEALPASGWEFDDWSGDAAGRANPLLIVLNTSKSITLNFTQLSYTLAIAKIGSGSVKVNGAAVTLPYSAQFLSGTAVTVEAVAQSGWEFDSWSGDASGSASPITVTMSSAKSVTATFTQLSYTLSISKVGSGSVKVNGAAVTLPYSAQFLSGTAVTVEAVAQSGWEFDSWSGDASGGASPITVTMGSAKSVTATFAHIQYTLSLSGVGSGSVTINGTAHSLPWSGSFYSGDAVTLAALPEEGWRFSGWSGGASWPTSPLAITMDSDKSIVATFDQLSYTVSLSKSGNGSVLVNGASRSLPWSGEFVYGTEVRLQAVPAEGWRFDGWSGDSTWPGSTLIINLTADKNLTATFSNASYRLSVAGTGSGELRVNGALHSLPWSGTFVHGTDVTLEAEPADGWRFDGWSGDANWPGATLVVHMTSEKSLTAAFSDASYTLSLTDSGSGTVRVNGTVRALPWSGRFLKGSEVSLEAEPAEGWQFDGWSGDANWSGDSLAVTMSSDKSIAAAFSERTSFNVLLTKDGSGSLTVNGDPVTLPWSGTFDRDAVVSIEATPDTGWQFDGWSGDSASSDGSVSLTMDRDWTLSAAFSQLHYELAVDGAGSGSIEVNGEAQSLRWSGSFLSGAQVTVKAVADRGWRFVEWSGDVSSADESVTVEMTGDKSISATFVQPDEYMLSLTGIGSGTVKVNGTEQALPWTGSFSCGSEVTLEAVPGGAEEFVSWSGDATGSDNPISVTMDYDMEITASFICAEPPFPDVPCDFWAAEAVRAVKDAGIAGGYTDGLYRPARVVDRGAMAVFIARALAGGDDQIPAPPDAPTFSDVPPTHWAYSAIEYVAANDIVQGYGDGSYQPSWQVTRGQMAVFIARSIVEPLGEQGLEGYEPPSEPTFRDVPTSYWSYRHIEYLAEHSIISGYGDGLYRPAASVSRDQMAVYVARAFGLVE